MGKLNSDLYTIFNQIVRDQTGIRLLNIYKGLPISYDASIHSINGDSITLKTNKYQLVCLYLERETFIQSVQLPNALRAKLVHLDAKNLEATFTGFEYVKGGIGDREQVRVDPNNQITCFLQPKNTRHTVEADVSDISQDGIGIILDRGLFIPSIYQIGAEITIFLAIPETGNATSRPTSNIDSNSPMSRFSRENLRGINYQDNTPNLTSRYSANSSQTGILRLAIRAIIRNLRPELNLNRYRIGMRIFPDDQAHLLITQFISLRQSEIIREIRMMFDLLEKFNN